MKKNINFLIDEELRTKIKIAAANHQTTITEILIKAIKEYLAKCGNIE